jgi:hypothetical protein
MKFTELRIYGETFIIGKRILNDALQKNEIWQVLLNLLVEQGL